VAACHVSNFWPDNAQYLLVVGGFGGEAHEHHGLAVDGPDRADGVLLGAGGLADTDDEYAVGKLADSLVETQWPRGNILASFLARSARVSAFLGASPG
jgi:hypothetical protein